MKTVKGILLLLLKKSIVCFSTLNTSVSKDADVLFLN